MPEQLLIRDLTPPGASAGSVEPAYYLQSASAPEPESDSPSVPFSHYLWILRRHLWKILAFVAACLLVTAIVIARSPRLYESTATINVDFQTPLGVVGQQTIEGDNVDPDTFLATQLKLIESDSVLRPVAEQFNLLNSNAQKSSGDPAKMQRIASAPVSLGGLSVSRPVGTYLLLVKYRSTDPQRAADVANAVARSYIAHNYNLRIESSANVSSFMEKQLDELKAKMEQSNIALAAYQKDLDVINPDEKTSILSARLTQLTSDYTAAQEDRVSKEAALDTIKSGSLAAEQVSSQGSGLAKLNDDVVQAQRHFDTVKATYGSSHPEYRKAATQLAEVEKEFEDARQSTIEKVAAQYSEALNREQMIEKDLTETKAEWDSLSTQTFEYQQLKHDADADKALYDELVRKIREADINSGFQANNISISDPARPSLYPVSPKIRMDLMMAFLLSLIGAIGAAILHDLLDTTLRDPAEASRFLGAEVIASLPVDRTSAALLKPFLSDISTDSVPSAESNGKGYKRPISNFHESVRTLRNTILLSDREGRLRSIALTSAIPSEGKTTLSAHLALANAKNGRKTLIVDGDLHRPSLHSAFGLPLRDGLSNVLNGQLHWRDAITEIDGVSNLYLLSSGAGSHRAADLIGPRIPSLLDEFAREFDMVILDSPPLLGFAESLQMCSATDGVLIVSHAGTTQRKAVAAVVSALRRVRANIIGVVLNQVSDKTSSAAYAQYSYQQYGRDRKPEA